jgi:hypothetical protein
VTLRKYQLPRFRGQDQPIADDRAAGDDGLPKALREIITKITVMPAPARQAPEIKVEGHLEILLSETASEATVRTMIPRFSALDWCARR